VSLEQKYPEGRYTQVAVIHRLSVSEFGGCVQSLLNSFSSCSACKLIPSCLPVSCLPVSCLPVSCLPVSCLPAFLPSCLPAFLPSCLLPSCLLPSCLPVSCLPAFLSPAFSPLPCLTATSIKSLWTFSQLKAMSMLRDVWPMKPESNVCIYHTDLPYHHMTPTDKLYSTSLSLTD
jgi:hypothetical protein